MVNIFGNHGSGSFGGQVGPRIAHGLPGPKSIWLQGCVRTLLLLLKGWFRFKEAAEGIQTLISHSVEKHNADGKCKDHTEQNSLYEAKFVTLSDPGPAFVCLCVPFLIQGYGRSISFYRAGQSIIQNNLEELQHLKAQFVYVK